MLTKVAVVFLALAGFGYIAAVFVGDVLVYIVCFSVLVAAVLFGLLVAISNLLWRFSGGFLGRKYKVKKCYFNLVFFAWAVLFLIGARILNKSLLADVSAPFEFLGNGMIFTFSIFLAWNLIRRGKARTIFAGSAIFILFVGALTFVGSITSGSGKSWKVDSTDALKSLGYVAWVPAEDNIEKRGVIQYERTLAFEGFNLYNSWALPEVYLIDMQGNVVHKWATSVKGIDNLRHHAEIRENGDLLVVAGDQMLMKLDWNSNIKWKTRMRAHHDFCVGRNGEIYAIGRDDRLVFRRGVPVPILDDYVAVISPDGTILKKISVYELVKEHISLQRLIEIYRWILSYENMKKIFKLKAERGYSCKSDSGFDILHTNSIKIMDRDIEGFCKKGDWLISIRELDFIGILDVGKKEFVWQWNEGELDRQHYPTLLENGNVLVFDNGVHRNFSRVIELDPLSKKVVWEYKAEPREDFFAPWMGSCQRLPNGNTLITESTKGRVFEVTREGEVVWDFYNPDIKTKRKKRRSIYRMIRAAKPESYVHPARSCSGDVR